MSFLNNKYTKWVVGALVLMNMFLLFAFFTMRPSDDPHHRRGQGNPSEKIQSFFQKELNLSEEQKVKFKDLGKTHFEKRKELFLSIRNLKKEMIDAISKETPDTEKANDFAKQIGELETTKEKLLINHYLDLQAECTVEQREKLEHVFKRAMRRSKFRKGKRGGKKGSN